MKAEVKAWLNEQFQGDEGIIATVWSEYLRSMQEKIGAARLALVAADFVELDRFAHTMKGDALIVGDHPMADAAIALRNASKASDPIAASQAIDSLIALDRANRE